VLDKKRVYLFILVFKHTSMKTTKLALLCNVFLSILLRGSSSYVFDVTH